MTKEHSLPVLLRPLSVVNFLSATLLLIYWYSYVFFLPYTEIRTGLGVVVSDPDWLWINICGVLGSSLAVPGTLGIYLRASHSLNRWGHSGFAIALVGASWMLAPLIWDTVLWLPLHSHDADILTFDGPIYSSALFLPFFIGAGFVWGVGFLIFGTALARQSAAGRPAWMLAVGPLLFAMGSLLGPYQAIPRSLGISLFCAGVALLSTTPKKSSRG